MLGVFVLISVSYLGYKLWTRLHEANASTWGHIQMSVEETSGEADLINALLVTETTICSRHLHWNRKEDNLAFKKKNELERANIVCPDWEGNWPSYSLYHTLYQVTVCVFVCVCLCACSFNGWQLLQVFMHKKCSCVWCIRGTILCHFSFQVSSAPCYMYVILYVFSCLRVHKNIQINWVTKSLKHKLSSKGKATSITEWHAAMC